MYLSREELIKKLSKSVQTRAIMLSGAPYDSELIDGIMSLFDDVEIALDPYRKKINKEVQIDNEELIELNDILDKWG